MSSSLMKEAQDPKTTPARLVELAAAADPLVRRLVARNRNVDEATLGKLLADSEWDVRVVAAHNPKAPRERSLAVVAECASSEDVQARRVAAKSRFLSVDQLTELTRDPDAEVRSNALKNARTPAPLARGALTDPEPCVVLGALAHPSVSTDERRAFMTEEFLGRFFAAHADGDYIFEALIERYLWDILERTWPDIEKFDDFWQQLVAQYFVLVEIPSRNSVLPAIPRHNWPSVISRIASEIRHGQRSPD